MKPLLIAMLSVCLSTSCGIYGSLKSESAPDQTQLLLANYGPPPAEYREKIQRYFHSNLVNPVGVILEYGEPIRGWMNLAREPNAAFPGAHGTRVAYGYIVCGFINAQNRMGGYTGRQLYFSFFERGEVAVTNWGSPAWDICKGNIPRP